MTNTSATGGYLLPDPTTPPMEDQPLARFLQQVVAAVCGLPGNVVFQRWQAEPPNLPARDVTWGAVGVVGRTQEANPLQRQTAAGDGSTEMVRNEELQLVCSFYGPACEAAMGLLREGLYVAQNREVLQLAGMDLVGVADPVKAPAFLKGQWVSRVDLPVTIRREIRRTYPVLNLLSAAGEIDFAVIDVEFDTQRNTP